MGIVQLICCISLLSLYNKYNCTYIWNIRTDTLCSLLYARRRIYSNPSVSFLFIPQLQIHWRVLYKPRYPHFKIKMCILPYKNKNFIFGRFFHSYWVYFQSLMLFIAHCCTCQEMTLHFDQRKTACVCLCISWYTYLLPSQIFLCICQE